MATIVYASQAYESSNATTTERVPVRRATPVDPDGSCARASCARPPVINGRLCAECSATTFEPASWRPQPTQSQPAGGRWALLAPRAVAARWVDSGQLPHPVSTVTADPGEALALLGTGQVDGLMVLTLAQLDGVIVPLLDDGAGRPRVLPRDQRAQRIYAERPEVRW
jgi:hypothetical protein